MLRFTLFSLVVIVIAIICLGSKMHTVAAHHTDSVSQVEQFMSH